MNYKQSKTIHRMVTLKVHNKNLKITITKCHEGLVIHEPLPDKMSMEDLNYFFMWLPKVVRFIKVHFLINNSNQVNFLKIHVSLSHYLYLERDGKYS